jgi:Fungal Zn(2)-Cys(6) binuclear cluster domain
MSDQDSRKGSAGSARRRSSASQPSESITATSTEQSQHSKSVHRSSSLFSPSGHAPAFRLTKSPNDRPPTKAPKVAIPRLLQKGESPTGSGAKSGSRHRVMHACEPCRSRKTKCSGEKPACKHCQDFKVTCVYADGKRDRAKK